MKLNHIYKSIACGVLLAMTATSCDLDYNPVDTYSDVTEGVNKTDEKPIFQQCARRGNFNGNPSQKIS